MKTLRAIRRFAYLTGRVLGDVLAAFQPRRLPARAANKLIGRKLVRRLWR